MNNLETYIRTNRSDFDIYQPSGKSRMHFMEKLRRERRKRTIRVISLSFTTVAAASAAIFMAIGHRPDISDTLMQQHKLLADKEMEVTALVNENFTQETESILDAISSITADAIPFEEQLPEELPDKEKALIIKEYYNRKAMALEQLKSQYIESL